jgi:DNA-binding PadR family transcriptional regulator
VTTSEDHTWDLLFHLADDAVDAIHPDDATAVVDIHASNIRKVLNALEGKQVVETVSSGRRKEYRLNVEGLEQIVENHRKRQRAAEFRQEL